MPAEYVALKAYPCREEVILAQRGVSTTSHQHYKQIPDLTHEVQF